MIRLARRSREPGTPPGPTKEPERPTLTGSPNGRLTDPGREPVAETLRFHGNDWSSRAGRAPRPTSISLDSAQSFEHSSLGVHESLPQWARALQLHHR